MDRQRISTPASFLLIPCLVLCLTGACRPAPADAPAPRQAAAPAVVAPSRLPAPAADRQPAGARVVFLGDSLTAGLGLEEVEAYPALVARWLAVAGTPIQAVNAGVSGDTTAGGLARLDWLLGQHPDIVVVGLGANDGLRGLPLDATERNLRAIVRRCRAAGARVLLLGMQIPPNYGPDYTGGFRAMYPRIAGDLDVPLVPFLLAGVGGVRDLNQADGIHPTAAGQEKVADNVTPYLEKLLARQGAAAQGGR